MKTLPLLDVGQSAIPYLNHVFARWVVVNFSQGLASSEKVVLEKVALAVSYSVHLKHTCLDIDVVEHLADKELSLLLRGITCEQIQTLFQHAIAPLICSADGKKIWLQKYAFFEQQCVEKLRMLAEHSQVLSTEDIQHLNTVFVKPSEQKNAAEKALQKQLAVITGGPGTGKTYTVARIIALLLRANPQANIVLAAPTGKAAQRMKEALDKAMSDDALLPYADALPAKASTLHSLLGISYGSPKSRRNHINPLAIDVLIIDEASMIDLPMMYRLLDALPSRAKLILLGDKDQLASVEAGSVLGELCQSDCLADCIANITHSRRFDAASEIGVLAQWLNHAENSTLPDMSSNTSVHFHLASDANVWSPEWLPLVLQKQQVLQLSMKTNNSVKNVLQQQKDFQLLCALREGPYGVNGINGIVERALSHTEKSWYAGMPVMIAQNDNDRKLYNGDVGMVLPLNADNTAIDINSKQLKACFLSSSGFKVVSQAQMPLYETCYAITVHKSQGSEYKHIVIVLPANSDDVATNPVLSKELAYTAVTRAVEAIDIWAGEEVLEIMASRRTLRMSGLSMALDAD
jgi:exodeoxyribonuclease V alpha subunit